MSFAASSSFCNNSTSHAQLSYRPRLSSSDHFQEHSPLQPRVTYHDNFHGSLAYRSSGRSHDMPSSNNGRSMPNELDIDTLVAEGMRDAAARDDKMSSKRKAFTSDYENLNDGKDDGRRDDTRPSSNRSDEGYWEERARNGDRSRRHNRYYEEDTRPSVDSNYRRHKPRSRSPTRGQEYRPRSSGKYDRSPRNNGRDSRHHRERDDEHDRERDREHAADRNERRHHGGRWSPRRGGGRRRDPSPESDNGQSDSRTVFVQQLANRARTKHVIAFFSAAGKVIDATIVKDRLSGRSKGVAYVQFQDEESVKKAIDLTGHQLCGIPVIVQNSEAEKNRQARTESTTNTLNNGQPFHRLYVGNIHFNIEESDLKSIFESYGEIDFVQLHKGEDGRSRGYGFVQFQNPENATTALAELNNFELAGRPIRVGLGNNREAQDAQNAINHRIHQKDPAEAASSFSGAGGRGSHAGGSTNFDGQHRDRNNVNSGALDDTDIGGVNFNNFSRDSLMRKLARTEDDTSAAQASSSNNAASGSSSSANRPAVARFNPTRCVLVKNAFDEAEETEPNWEKDLEEDFMAECAAKYGPVVHVGIPSERSEGSIFVKFTDLTGGDNALKGLNGRFFGGRVLTAQPVVDAIYNINFPDARNL